MPKKSTTKKKTSLKQKQSQSQKIVVNIGERKIKKRKRTYKRRPKEPSQEAQEYAESISRIIPRIQYNFPQHSSFNYDAYQTPNLVPSPKPAETVNPIAIEAPPKKGDLLTLSQELKEPPKLKIMDDKPYVHNEMDIKKPEMSGNFTDPILKRDRYNAIYGGIMTPTKTSRKIQTDELLEEDEKPKPLYRPQEVQKRIPILSDVKGESISIESEPNKEMESLRREKQLREDYGNYKRERLINEIENITGNTLSSKDKKKNKTDLLNMLINKLK